MSAVGSEPDTLDLRAVVDYQVNGVARPHSRSELVELLVTGARSGRKLRLVGGGTQQRRLPPPPGPVHLIAFDRLAAIQRLEADDLTCSVEPGLRRVDLDRALAERGLWLPCAGVGTLGGMFAADLFGPLVPGGFGARGLLLGLEGVLAEGLMFKSGARVVKSVAGYDVHKLFVGSRGRLFAATLLHLKLRPRPRRLQAFARTRLALDEALTLFADLRATQAGVLELWLERTAGQTTVRGLLGGNPFWVDALLAQHRLEQRSEVGPQQLEPGPSTVVVQGRVRPSCLPGLLAVLPEPAVVLLHGAGGFEVALAPDQIDGLWARANEVPMVLEVRAGPAPLRGRSTALDPTAAVLQQRVKSEFDPGEVLQ